MEFKVKDNVIIIDKAGNPIAEGTIYNINEFREENMIYAVDVIGYSEDVLFFGKSQLKKKGE